MVSNMEKQKKKIEIAGLAVNYGQKKALKGISLDVYEHEILGVIGPAQSGKTTLLKVINRTIEFIPEAHVQGMVKVNGENIKKVKSVYQTATENRDGVSPAGRFTAVYL